LSIAIAGRDSSFALEYIEPPGYFAALLLIDDEPLRIFFDLDFDCFFEFREIINFTLREA
jgi:hypothetical protein